MTDRDRQPMKDVSHTNPYTGETFSTVYQRGPAVADGGETETRETDDEPEAMKDIDHTPPHGESANEVWERGGEDAPDDAVAEDEVDE
ncbi:hypothetical protein [Halogranum rubrum]|uniref:Uncharacterized protein n=1 Tax=Halogranum salarium B-1 TaxID=1210908 RepID=J3JHT5_9EURY|nr:hypothetical protein [Halogranum salarium]EJN61279.1 hypothetical protein HSB1_03200 [Halogranum salarium B-1]